MKSNSNDYILSINNLKVQFKSRKKLVKAVDGVSFNIRRNKTLGLVGESGCGKSVTAHSIMRLLPKTAIVPEGEIIFKATADQAIDMLDLKPTGRKVCSIRGNDISMIFQDPMSSLNPVYKIGDQIIESILEHETISKKSAQIRALDMLEKLGISHAEKRIEEYPHQFSGGMVQRVMIAMGLICNPKLLIADEPTTALDVTIQAQILELMQEMQEELGFSIMLITHNMGIVADVADDIAVMYMGKIMEFGTKEDIFLRPTHPYTKALLKSVPVLGNTDQGRLIPIKGYTPDPSEMPKGCAFAPRCDYATKKCKDAPPYIQIEEGHYVRCNLFEKEEI